MPQTLLDEQSLVFEVVTLPHPEATTLMEELNQRLASIIGATGAASFDAGALVAGRSLFMVARGVSGEPLGCGAVRPLAAAGAAPVAELKRMYAREPGRGVGSALLAQLEQAAWAMGYRALWLETRQVNRGACAFYRRHGYHDIPRYGPYVGRADAVCLGKRLSPPPASPEALTKDGTWT